MDSKNLVINSNDIIKVISFENEIDIYLSKEEILGCGRTGFEEDGYYVIETNIVEVKKDIMYTLLALKYFGSEYKIVATSEYTDEERGYTYVFLHTNLPYEKFKEVLDNL